MGKNRFESKQETIRLRQKDMPSVNLPSIEVEFEVPTCDYLYSFSVLGLDATMSVPKLLLVVGFGFDY